MFQPSWRGKINLQNGLYYSNPKNSMKDKDTIKDTTKNSNTYNFTTSDIPYYNVNLEYLQTNINNQTKDNTNYYNLLDRIGYISRYLLKGNDYHRLYISKNSNKYFNNENEDIDMKNDMKNNIKNDIRKYNSTHNTMNDTMNETMNESINESINDTMNDTMNDTLPSKNNRYI